ncbi:MAG: LamG domain-containing protein [Cyanobacteria bacterium CRU_2_1]|nr:LamG domain-containing protein [Cyanobacteria bacterium CRU_2_1]
MVANFPRTSSESGRADHPGKGNQTGAFPYALRYSNSGEDMGKLYLERSDGSKRVHLISRTALNDGRFHHIAAVKEKDSLTLHIDGREESRVTLSDPTGNTSNSLPLCFGNSGKGFWKGQLDEVRLWNLARSPQDLRDTMHHRLIGNEPELVGYWRFDEGTGTTVYDQSDHANNGAIEGSGIWVKSEAIVGEHPGVRRMSFTFEDRAIAAGCSAVMYYQQEKVGAGYNPDEAKPMKRNARVMLTVPTSATPPSIDKPNRPYLAVLDFAVARDGNLAQVPDQISLKSLIKPDFHPSFKAMLAASRNPEVQSFISSLTDTGSINEPLQMAHKLETSIIPELKEQSQVLKDAIAQLQREIEQGDRVTFRYNHPESGPATTLLPNGTHTSHQILNDNFRKIESGSFTIPEGMKVEIAFYPFQGDPRTNLKILTFTADTPKKEIPSGQLLERVTITGSNLALAGKRRELEQKQQNLLDRQRELEEAEQILKQLREFLRQEVNLPMPLLTVDPDGLTVLGALLEFAWTDTTPLLFESVNGRLSLYFRGQKGGEFFAAYYDVRSGRSTCVLPAGTGTVSFTARAAGVADGTEIAITDSTQPHTCTVTIANEVMDIREVWQQVPRQPQQFANVLNGLAQPLFVGRLNQILLSGMTNLLEINGQLQQDLPEGAILLVGEAQTRAIVKETVPRGRNRTIPIQPVELSGANLSVQLLPYDYATHATTNKLARSLSNGSLMFVVDSSAAKSSIPNGASVSSGAIAGFWFADSQGNTLNFTAESGSSLSETARMADFAAQSDLTLEAWVNPQEIPNASARMIYHQSPDSRYTLGLQKRDVLSAAQFSGKPQDLITASCPKELNGNVSFTVSCWMRFNASSVRQWVMDWGQPATNAGVQWFINPNGQTQFGFVNSTQIPMNLAQQVGKWVFVATVYDAVQRTLTIYLNGDRQGNSVKVTDLPNLKPDGGLRLGSRGNSIQDANLNGAIDDLRLWKTALSAAQIRETMHRRLTGQELDLVGYWYFEGQEWIDHSPNQNHGRKQGTIGIASSPLLAYSVFAGVGGQSLQTKTIFPGHIWNHLAAVYNQSYGLRFDGQDDVVDCGNDITLDIFDNLTIEAWIKPARLEKFQGIACKGQGGRGMSYALYLDGDRPAFAYEDSKGKPCVLTSTLSLKPNTFYKLVVTRSITTENLSSSDIKRKVFVTFYLEESGKSKQPNSQAPQETLPASCNHPLLIGGKLDLGQTSALALLPTGMLDSLNRPFMGDMAEVRLWNVALTQEEINQPLTGSEKGLVSWWRFEENTGNIVYDSKSNNHGTRTGATWIKSPDPEGSQLLLYVNGDRHW